MNRRYYAKWENWHKTFISSRILCLPDTYLANITFIYELLRLAEKPTIDFLMKAISIKKIDLGVYYKQSK